MIFISLTLPSQPHAQDQSPLSGFAIVIDGDTIKVENQRVRLHGIDAPESNQVCTKNNNKYHCGKRATQALTEKIAGAVVYCEKVSMDRYNRIVGICRIGKVNLNRWMVLSGWAVAYLKYSKDYEGDEKAAKSAKIGLWSGHFIKPSLWRKGMRLPSHKRVLPNNGICVIKGNIGRNKKLIYHLPSGRYYAQTKINQMKGERWFCSEEEAKRAGWRKSRR